MTKIRFIHIDSVFLISKFSLISVSRPPLGLVPSSLQDVAADPVAFNVLLAEAQNAQDALRLLEQMGNLALRPTLVTLNSGAAGASIPE